jgi:hypothetical protein
MMELEEEEKEEAALFYVRIATDSSDWWCSRHCYTHMLETM